MTDKTKGYRPSSMYIAPTIVLGLGGTGTSIIRHLKARLRQAVGDMPMPRLVEFLAVDTEPIQNLPGEERLYDGEIAYIGDFNAGAVLENLDRHPHIEDWWFTHGKVVGSIYKGARQRRAVGRLSLYAKWGEFTQRLDPKIRRVQEIAEKEKTERFGLDVERTGQVRVYILASVCGGTGSGTFLDSAFRVRKALGDEAEIIGIFFLPSCFMPNMQSQVQKERVQGNAYAALRELNHFLSGGKLDATFPDTPFFDGAGNKVSTTLSRPFDSVFLVDSHNGKEYMSDLREIQRMTAQFIYLDMITPIGKRLAGRRVNLNDLAGEQRSSGKRAKSAALAIAGFVTASLVLPSTVVEEATNRYASFVLNQYVLGTEQISAEAQRQMNQLKETWQNSLAYPSGTKDAKQGKAQEELRKIAERIISAIQTSVRTRGIRDGVATANAFAAQLNELITIFSGFQNDAENEKKQGEKRLGEVTSTGRKLLGLFSRGGDDEAEDQKERHTNAIRQGEQKGAHFMAVVSGLTHLRGQLHDIVQTMQQRIELCDGWQSTLTQPVEKPKFNKQRGRDTKPSDLFELATELGNERAVEELGSNQYAGNLLGHYINNRVSTINLKSEVKEQLLNTLKSLHIFDIEMRTDETGIKFVTDMAPNADLLNAYKDAIQGFLANHDDVFSNLGVSDYLTWFYDNVPYATAESHVSRNSPIDPLRQLRYRSYAPFLNIDAAQLGTEHGFDTEPVRLIGANPLPSQDMRENGQHPLDEFGGDNFDMIDTGMPNRLDVLYARFGYKVDDLANLKDYYKSYRYFTETLGDPLHIHRDWPVGMSNLVDDPAVMSKAADVAAVRLRTVGDGWSHPRYGRATGAEAVIHRVIELPSGFSWSLSLIADDLDSENDELSRLWIRRISQSLEETQRQIKIEGERAVRLKVAFETARQRANEDVDAYLRQQGRAQRRLAYAATVIEDDCMIAAANGGDLVRVVSRDGTVQNLSGDGLVEVVTLRANDNVVLASDGLRDGYTDDTLKQALDRYPNDPRMVIDRVVDSLRTNSQHPDISLIVVRMIEA